MASETTEFVGERIEPCGGTHDTARMARGEPGLPRRFRWRGSEHEIADVLETWKTTGDCTHGSGERYVRKHWYRVRTTAGTELKLSFDRNARTPRALRDAWWLHAIVHRAASPGTRS